MNSASNKNVKEKLVEIEDFGMKIIPRTFIHGIQKQGEHYFNKLTDNVSTITFSGIEKKHGSVLNKTITVDKGGIWIYENNGTI